MTCALWFVFSILMACVLFFVFLTLMTCALCFVFEYVNDLRALFCICYIDDLRALVCIWYINDPRALVCICYVNDLRALFCVCYIRDLTIRQRRRPWKSHWKIDLASFQTISRFSQVALSLKRKEFMLELKRGAAPEFRQRWRNLSLAVPVLKKT